MTVKLLTEHHLDVLSLKEAAQACLSLDKTKCHIVGNHMSRLIYTVDSEIFARTLFSRIALKNILVM